MHLSPQKKNWSSAKNLSSTVPCDLALKILNRVPPEHRQSFTEQQVIALQTALVEKRKKSIFTVTLGPCDLSLVVGRDQRMNSRQLSQSMLAPILCIMVSMLGVGGVMGLLKFRYGYQSHVHSALQNQQQAVHPTVLPFRKDPINCEKNGAVWMDNECVDHDHDPTF